MSNPRLYRILFQSNSTWTVPAGIKFIFVTGCGGGGGGGGGAGARDFSGNANSPLYRDAGGGVGGEPAITTTEVVQVTPGTTYNIVIGQGGAGGCGAGNSGGGTGFCGTGFNNLNIQANGINGSRGGDSSFGSISFAGGEGGAGGPVLHYTVDPYLRAFLATAAINGINSREQIGPSPFPNGGRGGGAGGVSNNIYSFGGAGGSGSNDTNWTYNFFSLAGGGGTVGGGGGGGGAGSCTQAWNNNHDGALGGPGGNGFIEVAWIA